ncbi:hypothetical protein PEC18_36525 [Paucibacter sp. O1-1]|nr:hypothetical protein [Paucibacter sp. O1-1]MDA3831160.1 hypothetical protein [Paucibacter sp. O1-1]
MRHLVASGAQLCSQRVNAVEQPRDVTQRFEDKRLARCLGRVHE